MTNSFILDGQILDVSKKEAVLNRGRNSLVDKLTLSDGSIIILKKYPYETKKHPSRIEAEWTFLTFLNGLGKFPVAKPLLKDETSQTAAFSYLSGRKITTYDQSSDTLEQLAAFIVQINRQVFRDNKYPFHARDSWASVFSVFEEVHHRIASLIDMIDISDTPFKEIASFIDECLKPGFKNLESQKRRSLSEFEIINPPLYLSPSDFGLHNALINSQGKLSFVDFEYAGLDDLAKLVADTFCCPQVPLPLDSLSKFVDILNVELCLDIEFEKRVENYLALNRYRWLCIQIVAMLKDLKAENYKKSLMSAENINADHLAPIFEYYEKYCR